MGGEKSLRNVKLAFLFGVGILIVLVFYLNFKGGNDVQEENKLPEEDNEVVEKLDIDELEEKYRKPEDEGEDSDNSEGEIPEDEGEQSNYQNLSDDEIGYEDEGVDFKKQIIEIVGSEKEYKNIMKKAKEAIGYVSSHESIESWKQISTKSFVKDMEQGKYDEITSLEVADFEVYPDEQFGDDKVIVSSILDVGESTKYIAIIFSKENKEFLLDDFVLMPEYN